MLILIAGAVAGVVVEWLILRWVGKRDRMFPALPSNDVFGLITRATSKEGAARLLAADRYVRLRRSVYFAGWRTKRAGGSPGVTDVDVAQLAALRARASALPGASGPAAASATAPTDGA